MDRARNLNPTTPEKVGRLEHQLAGSLKPIAARGEFVRGLGSRIHSIRPPAIVNRVENIHLIALVVAGFLAVGVLVAFVARALAQFLGRKPLSDS